MNKRKWYATVILGLILILASFLSACAKKEEVTYAPDFTLPSLDGIDVTLADLRGKPVMLTFWTINCPACQLQMPYIQSFYDEWSDEKVKVLTINAGDSATIVQDYVTYYKLTFPVLLDLGQKISRAYGIPGVPTTFFIDAEGIFKAYKIGAFQSRTQIEEGLTEVFPSLVFTPKPKVPPEIGDVAPDFSLRTLYGQNVTLMELKGRTALLNFWMTSCPGCVDELPYLQKVADEAPDDELVILAVNVGEDLVTVLKTVDSFGLLLPVLLDQDGEICATYGRGCPTTYLIDSDGIIRAIRDEVFNSPEEIESMLDSL